MEYLISVALLRTSSVVKLRKKVAEIVVYISRYKQMVITMMSVYTSGHNDDVCLYKRS